METHSGNKQAAMKVSVHDPDRLQLRRIEFRRGRLKIGMQGIGGSEVIQPQLNPVTQLHRAGERAHLLRISDVEL